MHNIINTKLQFRKQSHLHIFPISFERRDFSIVLCHFIILVLLWLVTQA